MTAESGRLLLYAPNVHTGGGFVLLQALLQAWPAKFRLLAWLDERARARLSLPAEANVEWVRPSVRSRLRAEYRLAKVACSDDRVLFFHGLPPLLPNKGQSLIFQQNRNYLGLVPLRSFAWRTRQRLRLEQAVARLFRHRVTTYWVQTPSMARELRKWYGDNSVNIRVLPFSLTMLGAIQSDLATWDFVYIADGEAHKNHRRLIEAWTILARQGIKPSLALTLSERDVTLSEWINQQVLKHEIRVTNLGHLSHEKVIALYGQSKALIFPSISESFGLPLIEARQMGLPILASELDFVRDVCEPVQSFDPDSAVSIARAVRRFLGQDESPVQPVTAAQFLSTLTQGME